MGLPVVSWPYMPAAEMPMPCWPRDCLRRWNFEPYSSWAKIFGICSRTMPGPLSCTITHMRLSSRFTISTMSVGRMPASSQASRLLSTASLTVVIRARAAESKPSSCLFLAKNSEMEISRCWVANSSAFTRGRCRGTRASVPVDGEPSPLPASSQSSPNRLSVPAIMKLPVSWRSGASASGMPGEASRSSGGASAGAFRAGGSGVKRKRSSMVFLDIPYSLLRRGSRRHLLPDLGELQDHQVPQFAVGNALERRGEDRLGVGQALVLDVQVGQAQGQLPVARGH